MARCDVLCCVQAMSEMTTNAGPAMDIVQKFVEEEEKERKFSQMSANWRE